MAADEAKAGKKGKTRHIQTKATAKAKAPVQANPAAKAQAKAAADNNAPAAKAAKPQVKKKPQPLVPAVTVFDASAKPPLVLQGASRPEAIDIDDRGRIAVADRRGNRVLLYDQNGVKQGEVKVGEPIDADFIAGDRLLVVSAKDKAVLELDPSGKTVWAYRDLRRPRDADRLANGNTLIADTAPSRIIEVDRTGKIVWSHKKGLKLPSDAELAPDGNILVADYNDHTVRCLRRDGTTCWRFNYVGHPSQLHLLADGTFVVGTHKAGSIVWVGKRREILGHWKVGPDLHDFTFAGSDRLLVAQMVRPDIEFSQQRRRQGAGEALAARRAGAPEPQAIKLGTYPVDGVSTAGKNLVLVLVDSLRRDHVPWHGYWRNTAPRLARVAAQGLIFERYYTQAPWTKPSVASLLTSTYPSVHGATSQLPKSHLPDSLTTLAEALSGAGYFTAAVMQNPHMGDRRSSKGFEQGYQRYEYLGHKKLDPEMPALLTTTAIEVLDAAPRNKPFFLTVFFMNPHYPYEPHEFVFGKKNEGPSNPGPVNGYDGETLEADHEVARILDHLTSMGRADDTIFVFSSDHGEEFGDHGRRFHGDTLFDCVLAVPLIISGLDRAGRFAGLTREIDLFPTLLDYLGVAVSSGLRKQMAGVSLRPFIERNAARTGLLSYAQTRFRDSVTLVAERSEDRKVIADLNKMEVQIFDLLEDPQEYNNLADGEQAAREFARLTKWGLSLGPSVQPADSGEREAIPEEVLERLRAAGYLQDEQP